MNQQGSGSPDLDGSWRVNAALMVDLALYEAVQQGATDIDAIRGRIIGTFRRLLGESSPADRLARIREDFRSEGRGVIAVDAEAAIRVAIFGSGLDTREPIHAESYMCVVQVRLEQLLSRPDPLTDIRAELRRKLKGGEA